MNIEQWFLVQQVRNLVYDLSNSRSEAKFQVVTLISTVMIAFAVLCLLAVSARPIDTPDQRTHRRLRRSIHGFNSTHVRNDDDGGCRQRCNHEYEGDSTKREICAENQCEYGEDYCRYLSLEKCKEGYSNSYTQEEWDAACAVSCSVVMPDGCLKRCRTTYSTSPQEYYCQRQCRYQNNPGCRYTSIAYCKSGYYGDDDANRAYWDEVCSVSCSTTYSAADDDEKDCIERCEDKVDDKFKLGCIEYCQSHTGRCMYNSYSDCVDQYDSKDPILPDRANDDDGSIKDLYKEDEWKSFCKAICPSASLWWVFLIVGVVVVAAVAVILVLICFAKKLLCFGASKGSVAPTETPLSSD